MRRNVLERVWRVERKFVYLCEGAGKKRGAASEVGDEILRWMRRRKDSMRIVDAPCAADCVMRICRVSQEK